MALLTIMVLGLLDRQVLRILILQTKIYLSGVATYWVVSVNLIFGRIARGWHEKYGVVSVNLMFGRIVRGRHEKSDQPNCPTSCD